MADKKQGRPKKTWNEEDERKFKTLCGVFCTEKEICSVMGVDDKTLVRLINDHLFEDIRGRKKAKGDESVLFSEAFEKYSANGKASIRRMQYKAAESGNVTMMIWLGKQYLDQRDTPEVVIENTPVLSWGV